jgi:predicted ATPase
LRYRASRSGSRIAALQRSSGRNSGDSIDVSQAKFHRPPLRRISAENFLSFRKIDVPLKSLNVLVGPNGAGKTNLLSLIRFLGEIARTDLLPAIETFGGYGRLEFRGIRPQRARLPRRIRITIEAQITKYATPNAPDEYNLHFRQLSLRSGRRNLLKRDEHFSFKRFRGPGRRITVSGQRSYLQTADTSEKREEISIDQESSGLATLRRLNLSTSDQVDELATLLETFRVFEVDVEALRRPIAGAANSILRPSAANLSLFLEYLKGEHEEIFAQIEDDLRYIVPGMRKIHLERVGDGVSIEFEEQALDGRTPLSAASFGTVRGLAILAMLHDPAPPRLSCIEEIDHGFHPYALDRIVERLRLASGRTQILVATHSPALVNRLAADELIVCERNLEDGSSRIPAIDSDLVGEMEEESNLPLGELWFSGTLGGVP